MVLFYLLFNPITCHRWLWGKKFLRTHQSSQKHKQGAHNNSHFHLYLETFIFHKKHLALYDMILLQCDSIFNYIFQIINCLTNLNNIITTESSKSRNEELRSLTRENICSLRRPEVRWGSEMPRGAGRRCSLAGSGKRKGRHKINRKSNRTL